MADFDWKKFDLSNWWKALTAAGIALSVAAIAAKFPAGAFAGLGVLFLGIGEWHQHPSVTLPAASFGLPQGVVTTHERNVTPVGVAFDILGAVLLVIGFVKLLLV